jgi:putative membrane protein
MMGGSGMGWFWIWSVLVLAGSILLGYVAYRLGQGSGRGVPASPSSARQILDERYARGEINEREYRQRRADLQ